MTASTSTPRRHEATLLPCPFCGGDAEIDTQQAYRNIRSGNLETAIAVYCRDCGAQVMTCRGDVPDVRPEEVIEMWNKRAAIAAGDA
jgi:Lar family restriction alleviation protein